MRENMLKLSNEDIESILKFNEKLKAKVLLQSLQGICIDVYCDMVAIFSNMNFK